MNPLTAFFIGFMLTNLGIGETIPLTTRLIISTLMGLLLAIIELKVDSSKQKEIYK